MPGPATRHRLVGGWRSARRRRSSVLLGGPSGLGDLGGLGRHFGRTRFSGALFRATLLTGLVEVLLPGLLALGVLAFLERRADVVALLVVHVGAERLLVL